MRNSSMTVLWNFYDTVFCGEFDLPFDISSPGVAKDRNLSFMANSSCMLDGFQVAC